MKPTGSARRCALAASTPASRAELAGTIPIRRGKESDRDRHRVEIMFGRSVRHDWCSHTFTSTIAIAAIVLFWMPKR